MEPSTIHGKSLGVVDENPSTSKDSMDDQNSPSSQTVEVILTGGMSPKPSSESKAHLRPAIPLSEKRTISMPMKAFLEQSASSESPGPSSPHQDIPLGDQWRW